MQRPGHRPQSWHHWAALGSLTPWRFPARLPLELWGELSRLPGDMWFSGAPGLLQGGFLCTSRQHRG